VVFCGATDFMQSWKLDEWHNSGYVTFYFGVDARSETIARAEALPQTDWRRLERPAKYQVQTEPRAKRDNVKEQVVREKQFKNLVLQWEDVAEFKYKPYACEQTYRMIVLRKRISVEKGQEKLFEEYRYFFYITNDQASTAEEVVFTANDRCDQENLIAQLKSGTGSMSNPLDNLHSNWAHRAGTTGNWRGR